LDTAPGSTYGGYDAQARQHYWHPEALFGLTYACLHPGERLLDVGIGTGLASEPFASAGVAVFGLDSDAEMLALCRAKGFAADLVQHDLTITPWPYGEASFDHVLAAGVLHFFPDIEPICREVARVLRPGGTFTFTLKGPPLACMVGAGMDVERRVEETIQGATLYQHPRATVDRVLADCGLVVRKELRLAIETGRGTDDLFYALVTRRL